MAIDDLTQAARAVRSELRHMASTLRLDQSREAYPELRRLLDSMMAVFDAEKGGPIPILEARESRGNPGLGGSGATVTLMASAHDVAAYVLKTAGQPMSSMKLQKLLYYSQAWHLVWDEEPLFSEPIQAWANGPVVYDVFRVHRGQFTVSAPWPFGVVDNLKDNECETIDAVVESYGHLSGRQLSVLTHSEAPWREAREGYAPTARSNVVISLDRMQDFYASLDADDEAEPVEQLAWDGDPY